MTMYDLAIDHALAALADGKPVLVDTLRYMFGPAACKAADDLVHEGICYRTYDGLVGGILTPKK